MRGTLHVDEAKSGLSGKVRVPSDKSITHRAYILGAAAEGPSRLRHPSPGGDCQATLDCIQALGTEVRFCGQGNECVVQGQGLRGLREPSDALNCRRSGTTMRLIAGLLAGHQGLFILRGDPQLHRRPMGRIVEPLRDMGARVTGRQAGRYPPLVITGAPLRGVTHHIPVASAQVKSCLLLAGLLAEGRTLVESPSESRDHTERMLRGMGVPVDSKGPMISLQGPVERLFPYDLTVPGDFSSAAFLMVAAALVEGSTITVERLGLNPSRTGLLDALRMMGTETSVQNEEGSEFEPYGDLTVRWKSLQGIEVGGTWIVRMIDELPVLAVAATQAEGETVVRDAQELRHKESDRIATTVTELRKLGARIEERPDGFVVEGPTRLRGATVESHGDHRLAMALAVAGLVAEGETVVGGFDCVADSFPSFADHLSGLRTDGGGR